MTPEFLRKGAPAAVLAALPEARAVGGAVRDFLAGRPIHDVDVAVPLPPDEVTRRLRDAGLKVFETGLKHGTVTAVLDGEPVEVTSLRRDVATDGRHAEVEWVADWREDAARRDFTINAMSMGADGAVHDYFGGREDLAAGRVRFVGESAERLREDYLRALRFFRFWARYGRGEPDAAAVAAIREAVPGLARLSVERVLMEWKRFIQAPDPRAALRVMDATGVLAARLRYFFPLELRPLGRLIDHNAPNSFTLRTGALFPVMEAAARAEAFSLDLRASNDEAALLRALVGLDMDRGPDIAEEARSRQTGRVARLLPLRPDDADSIRVALFDASQESSEPHALIEQELWLLEARTALPEFAERGGLPFADIRAAVASTPLPLLPLQGRDALELGLAAGPAVGALLSRVRDWWRALGCKHDRDACLAKLRELANLPPA